MSSSSTPAHSSISSSVAESSGSEKGPVKITDEIAFVDVQHNGKSVRIQRVQDHDNFIEPDFAQTSRPCPPFCIQPIKLPGGVETIGELEMLHYLQRKDSGEDILVIDSREPEWLKKGMIPGAVNIPWTKLFYKTASEEDIAEILQFQFNVAKTGPLWSYQGARTLVFYCNGPWCGQSPTNIRALLTMGYPANLIKWYRGGMQAWLQFGLTTVKSD